MGRRKERRLAAKSAAGRRVKLDLSAEPTGEIDNTSLQDKAGVDLDMVEKQAGVPTSPSSSGQKPHSLLLLGQYSDDEAPDSATKSEERSGSDSPVDVNDKVPEADDLNVLNVDDKSVDIHNEVREESLEVDQMEAGGDQEDTKLERDTTNSSPAACSEMESTILPVPEVSGTQPVEDLTNGWKMVLHEESNRYYYWNMQTGETSWDVPEALSNQMMPAESTPIADDNIITTSTTVAVDNASVNASANSENANGRVFEENTVTTEVHHPASFSEQVSNSPGVFIDNCSLYPTESCEKALDQTSLSEQGESLLQKLKALERSSDLHEWSLKIILEIEIRLSDCKALARYESSLQPFWSYIEQRFKDIESTVNEKFTEMTAQHIKSGGYGDEFMGTADCVASGNVIVANMDSSLSKDIEAPATAFSEQNAENDEKGVIESEHVQPRSSYLTSEGLETGIPLKEATESAISTRMTLREELHADDDVDMDVEMEVDDEIPNSCNACEISRSEHSMSAELPSVQPEASLPSAQIVVPPSPSDDWIPPPPSEPFPPPPPETEPVPPEEALIPPPYTDTVQSYPYSEQYGVDYSVPSHYYTSVSEAHGISYYSHADLNHVSDPQPPQYYDALAHQSYYSSVSVGPIESAVYYNAHGGVVPVVTASNGIDSSVSYGESILTGIAGSVSSEYNECGKFSMKDDVVESGSQMPATDNGSHSCEIKDDNVQMTSALATSKPSVNINQNENSAHSVSTSISNNPAKVSRMKKRAVAVATSLRSNKKVSSLVDKWKAAKEELHGNDDDEVEDAYEILERKRKKGIEEWKARQIATGEAQANANFLPLGGDWRERVKRKRAESAEPVKPSSDEDKKEKKQPDLVELSRGLPSGWQAYWDESSKEVYYGNLQTSETTWTRPSK